MAKVFNDTTNNFHCNVLFNKQLFNIEYVLISVSEMIGDIIVIFENCKYIVETMSDI